MLYLFSDSKGKVDILKLAYNQRHDILIRKILNEFGLETLDSKD